MNWQDISTAPQDGTEVLCWREDCGPFIAKYTSADSFPLTQAEIDAMDEESLFHRDWFTQWPQAFRLDGSEAPTHWMPLPAAPGAPAVGESFEDRISDWAHGDALDAERYRWLFGARTADELQALTADSGPPLDKPQDVVMCELMTNYVTKANADAMIDGARADQAAAAKESP